MSDQQPTQEEQKSLRLEVINKMTDLATAGFGIVAALAWNDAIKALVDRFIPKDQGGDIIAQFIYALIITLLVVIVTLRLSKLADFTKKQISTAKRLDKQK